ncbi:uncharacterized protein LOC110913373 [Helianthus annuus]|uniref:uncharacterized protein LOC110913373 n=1 Tax=Helianthus annuus TaxID=4232 RepID=UPI000B906880|nr:uncharacterized protein LOC110913373 [Helianthus annuus]
MPEDLTDENFSLIANPDVSPDEFCFMALESIPEGQESEEVESRSEVVEEIMLEEKKTELLLEPLADPWDASVCEGECDCAMMAAAKGASVCLDSLWYVDSGGSRHMTGCRVLFKDFKKHGGGDISFGNNSKGKVLGSRTVQAGKLKFENVNLIDNLKFNLLSVSQMSDKGYRSFFTKDKL